MSDVSIWALVAAGVTGAIGLGGIRWQQRHRDSQAARAEKAVAYQLLIAESLSLTIRAGTARGIMARRSGVGEGLDVLLGFREPPDEFRIYDWFAKGFEPVNHAWSRIQVSGSPKAVKAATELVNACGDLVGVATSLGEARGQAMTRVAGMKWKPEQDAALAETSSRVIACRESFIQLAREELGIEPAELPIEIPDEPGEIASADAAKSATQLQPPAVQQQPQHS